MNVRRGLAILVAVSVWLPLGAATADEHCVLSVDETSASTRNIVDPRNDWRGAVFGNGDVGLGDVHREGTDVTGGWISRTEDGVLQAHIQVANLQEVQPNAIFYFVWDYAGDDPMRRRRWVQARIKNYAAPVFAYGYFAPPVTPNSNGTFATIGETTGSLHTGSNGEIVIDLPATGGGTDRLQNDVEVPAYNWGAPTSGSTLNLQPPGSNIPFGALSYVLVGSPEPIPPPSPLRHGYVYPADNSTNATEEICDAQV